MNPSSRILLVLWHNHNFMMGFVAALLVVSYSVVYLTGGTKFAHLHIVYVPILLSALRFKLAGAIVTGLAATLLMGPAMPLDVATGQMQQPANWLSRGMYLTVIGSVFGYLSQAVLRMQADLYNISNYDPITNLPLFESFRRKAEEMLNEDQSRASERAILNISLRNSIDIQSFFGSETHEECIKAIAERIQTLLPGDCLFARGGQIKFLVCAKNMSPTQIHQLTHRIAGAFDTPVEVFETLIDIQVDIGVANFPDHGINVQELVRASHSALGVGKTDDQYVSLFDPAIDKARRDNLSLAVDLKAALLSGDIQFHIQPKIRLRDGAVVGGELLARWTHEELGPIAPDRFIQIAEKSRAISSITDASFFAAYDYIEQMMEIYGSQDFRVAVNVSGRDVTSVALPSRLALAFRQNTQHLRRLELEITETAVVDDFTVAAPALEVLREMGVSVAIDDFGTGYSSLKYLQDIPADILKIDKSFVQGVITSSKNAALVKRTVDLAKDIGLESVAEGVEDEETAIWLRDNGCDTYQGYYCAKPMTHDDWLHWLRSKFE